LEQIQKPRRDFSGLQFKERKQYSARVYYLSMRKFHLLPAVRNTEIWETIP
jgi:hypothetical protein